MTIKSYHVIDLPDGTTTEGQVDRRPDPKHFGLEGCPLLQGARVLDVGAFDGVWSFWAEKAGADYVLATDVEEVVKYDWGWHGAPASLQGVRHDSSFHEIRRALGSKVDRKELTVYDIDPQEHGLFDLIVFYGLLYHLRHPLLAFDRLRAVCNGAMVVETHTSEMSQKVPFMLFYRDNVLANNPTNWCGPSEACVVHWMKDAGFDEVFFERSEKNPRPKRQRFIGTIDERWTEVFSKRPNFQRVTKAYLEEGRNRILRLLDGDIEAWGP